MRKLAYCAGGFSAAIFLAHFLLPGHWVLPAALAAVVLALTALLLPGAPRRRVMLALLSAAIGFGWYAAASAARLTPAEAVPDELQTLAGRVTEYPAAYEHSCGLTVLLTSPDVPHCRARLYVSDTEAAAAMRSRRRRSFAHPHSAMERRRTPISPRESILSATLRRGRLYIPVSGHTAGSTGQKPLSTRSRRAHRRCSRQMCCRLRRRSCSAIRPRSMRRISTSR